MVPGHPVTDGAPVVDARCGRRRRRPRRRCRADRETPNSPEDLSDVGGGGAGGTASPGPSTGEEGVPPALAPPCVIEWSKNVERADEANYAVIVTAFGVHGCALRCRHECHRLHDRSNRGILQAMSLR